jgi:hypothetical protein
MALIDDDNEKVIKIYAQRKAFLEKEVMIGTSRADDDGAPNVKLLSLVTDIAGETPSEKAYFDGEGNLHAPNVAGASTVTPEAFGAVGDGVTDDYIALQAAMDAAFNQRAVLEFQGDTYITSQTLINDGIELRGKRGNGGTIIATNSLIDSVMSIEGVTSMSDFTIEARHSADYSIKLLLSSYSLFTNVRAYGAVKDGWHLSDSGGGNDSVLFINCSAEFCGKIYRSSGRGIPSTAAPKTVVAGTVTTVAGNTSIIGVGTSFTTMGIRTGDFIGIGDDASVSEWIQIGSVVSDTELKTGALFAPAQSRAGQEFAVFVGDGYHEQAFGDNNNNHLIHFRTLNIAGCGATFGGIWGPKVDQFQADASGAYAIRLGLAGDDGLLSAPISTKIEGVYEEGFPETPQNGLVFISGANGVILDGFKTGKPAHVMPNPSLGYGYQQNIQSDPGSIRPVGDPGISYLLASNLYRPTLQGELMATAIAVSIASLSTTLNIAHATVGYLSSGAGTAGQIVTATPTLTTGAHDSQFLYLFYTDVNGSVTLQDESILTGSKLKLQSPTVTLARRDSLSLMWVDGFWRETARSIASAPAFTEGPLNVKDFGARGDGSTDDILAFEAAQDALPVNGGRIYVPPGSYFCSRPFSITKCVILEGASPGFASPSNAVSMMKFPSGSGGITVHFRYTIIGTPSMDGTWATIRNLYIENEDDGAGTVEGTGIQAFTRCQIENVGINGFFGSGIRVTAQQGIKLLEVKSKSGFMGGGAGTEMTASGGACVGAQILHDSHPTRSASEIGYLVINGSPRNFVAGEIVTCNGETCEIISNTPGFTNANGWQINHARISGCSIAVDCHGTDANVGVGQAIDVSQCDFGIIDGSFFGGCWIGCEVEQCSSAPYSVTAIAAQPVFINCYAETAQPNCEFTGPTLIVGGAWGVPFNGGPRSIIGGVDNRVSASGLISTTGTMQADSYVQSNVSGALGNGASAFYAAGASSGAFAAVSTMVALGGVSDGASAVGVISDNFHALTTAGAKVHSFRNANVEKAFVDKDGGLRAASIGVGNSAGGTTPGSCIKKIEVFDAAGVSLGFIPVYDAIT